MEELIKKAIEGGYKPEGTDFIELQMSGSKAVFITEHTRNGYHSINLSGEEIFCDPLFWQALGKSCGWLKYMRNDGCQADNPSINDMPGQGWGITWKKHALRFHEINLTEGWQKAIDYLTNLTH